MSEAIDYIITRMAAERGITADEMRRLIQEAIHSSSDLTLRREMRSRFGKRELTAEELGLLKAAAGMEAERMTEKS